MRLWRDSALWVSAPVSVTSGLGTFPVAVHLPDFEEISNFPSEGRFASLLGTCISRTIVSSESKSKHFLKSRFP